MTCHMLHSKIEFMKNDMSHVLTLKFYMETVHDCQKLIRTSEKVQMDTEKDISKREIWFMTI